MRLALINPAAGSRWRGSTARRALDTLTDVQVVETTRHAIADQVRALLTPGLECIFVFGGDGTVGEVANALEDSDVHLAIVPCGTTNVLAREFAVPLDPLRAVAAYERSRATRLIRLWRAGRRRLVLGAGVGWDARLMHRASPGAKRLLGFGALVPLAGLLLATYDFPHLEVTGLDRTGQPMSISGTSVLIANTRFWSGGNAVLPEARPDDDLLEVVVLQDASRSQLLKFWMRMSVPGSDPLRVEGVRAIQMRELEVRSTHPDGTEVHVNGDPGERTPLLIAPAGAVRIRLAAAGLPPR